MIRKYLLILIAMVAFSALNLHAQFRVSGALQAWLYAWENPNETQQVDYYQGFQFKLGNDGYKNLTFKTYFQAIYRGDPAEWENRAYNFLLDWKSNKRSVNLRLGRQFVYNGVINGTIDGLSISYRPNAMWNIKAIAGMEAPYNREFKFQSWDEHNAIGAFASVNPSDLAKIDVSYFQRGNENETIWQQFGTALNGELLNGFYYTAVYQQNLLKSEYQAIRFRLLYDFNPWSFSAEYNDQKPRIYEDSFFRRFKLFAYKQIRSQITYQLGDYQLGLQHLYTTYENEIEIASGKTDKDNQFVLSVNTLWGNAGFLYQSGYGGENIGAYGDVRYDIMDKLQARLFASAYNYQRQTVDITEDAVSFSLGLNYRLLNNLSIRAEGQQTANSYYKSEWRGLLFINYAFN